MNLLNRVVNTLAQHSDLMMVGCKETIPFAPRDDVWSHGVIITLCPKTPEWRLTALQKMLDNLLPEVERAHEKRFQERDTSIEFGVIWFKELLPPTPPFEADDREFEQQFSTRELFNEEMTLAPASKLKRGIWIHLYPCSKLAEESLEKHPIASIGRKTLEVYKLETA